MEYFPALERAFDYSNSKAALILLTGYQTPEALRRAGVARLAAWLRKRKARTADAVAAAALEAAHAQHTVLPGQDLGAAMVARLAKEVITLDTEIAAHKAPPVPIRRRGPTTTANAPKANTTVKRFSL